MSLSKEQLAIRKQRLSATDIGAILGLNPWRSAADVQAEKLYNLDPLEETEAMAIGNMVEPALIQWAGEKLGVAFQYPMPTIIHPKCDLLCATPDAALIGKPRGAEAKTGGIVRGFASKEEWGEDGSDHFPDMYKTQCIVQSSVMGWEVVYVPALLAGIGRRLYELAYSPDDGEAIIDITIR